MTELTEQVLRGITNDGAFRAITINATKMVQRVLNIHKLSGNNAQLLGQLLVAGVMIRETMAPGMRVQAILGSHPPKFSLVADARPKGMTRGLASLPEDGSDITLGKDTLLQVVRVLYNGELQQGIITTEGANGLAGAVQSYMLNSEQVHSLVDICCVIEDDPVTGLAKVKVAGGYIIQMLPEADEAALAIMTVTAESFPPVAQMLQSEGGDPEGLMHMLLKPFERTVLDKSSVHEGCPCSMTRVVGALATMGRAEIVDIVRKGEVLSIDCDYCRTNYQVGSELLKPLLDRN